MTDEELMTLRVLVEAGPIEGATWSQGSVVSLAARLLATVDVAEENVVFKPVGWWVDAAKKYRAEAHDLTAERDEAVAALATTEASLEAYKKALEAIVAIPGPAGRIRSIAAAALSDEREEG
jgi:hypothetical protein